MKLTLFKACFLFLFTITVVAAGCFPTSAQNSRQFFFKRIDVEDGLTQSMVYAILQDKQGFMWFGTQSGLNRYDGTSLKTYVNFHKLNKRLSSNSIFSLAEDNSGNIWIGTETDIVLFNPQTETFRKLKLTTDGKEIENGIVRTMAFDKRKRMWTGISGQGVFRLDGDGRVSHFPLKGMMEENGNLASICFDSSNNAFLISSERKIIRISNDGKVSLLLDSSDDPENTEFKCLKILSDSTLLAGTNTKGIIAVNHHTGACKQFSTAGKIPDDSFVRRIETAKSGNLWIGTQHGLYIHNPETGHTMQLTHSFDNPYSLSDNSIHELYRDRDGAMWVGTFFGGVNYSTGLEYGFEKFYPSSAPGSLQGKCISEFCEDSNGNIWVGTEDAGLNMMTPTEKFSVPFQGAENIHALLHDNGTVLAGTFSDGLYSIDTTSGKVLPIGNAPHSAPVDNCFYSIFKDSDGIIWLGTRNGLALLDKANSTLSNFPSGIKSQVNDIAEDSSGLLWFATIGQGILTFNKNTGEWCNLPTISANNPNGGEKVTCILNDGDKGIWAGTKGAGVVLLNYKGGIEKEFSTGNGLPDNMVYKLLKSPDGTIWGSTNSGLFRIDPNTGKVRIYTHSDGLPGNQFNYKSGFVDSKGNLYFGGVKGFVRFRHNKLADSSGTPNIVLNSLKIDNQEVTPIKNPSVLKESISSTKSITLPYGTSFSLGFGALNYGSPHRLVYDYMLEGWDKNWISADEFQTAAYSNLTPGKYIFRVHVSDVYGLWESKAIQLAVSVTPPVPLSPIALVSYAVAIILICYFGVMLYRRRIMKRQKAAIAELQHNFEKEMYDMKINFFTGITHELRTPLSLIKIPIEELLKASSPSGPDHDNLTIVKRNADRLLTLVNQLLDFRKAESSGMKLNFTRTDLRTETVRTCQRFRPSFDFKGITFDVSAPAGLEADIDTEAYTKIISNLLGNALKHAETFTYVVISEEEGNVAVSVVNDGNQIPESKVSSIFLPFVKLDERTEGSGIGLSLVKKLIEAHNGTVSVHQENNRIEFKVVLPLRQAHVIDIRSGTPLADTDSPTVTTDTKTEGKTTVLIVEDNPDMLALMSRQLKEDFNIMTAQNGREALQRLENEYADIVVSDVMMPVMNGMELCKAIKGNIAYSHIPVVLLTAVTDSHSCLKGLEIGADEYIVKPYSIDFLKARINNLIANRRKLIEIFKNNPEISIDTIADNEANARFMQDLVDCISANLADENLNVDFLASEMNMSRATLYRKIRSISEQTPNDFIRLIRLKKAAGLLRDKNLRIVEISEMCGFNSPSYFTKCFFKQFGKNPKDYQKEI